jgi:uncharacterized repeat protein (TIGR01451 family)
MLNVIRGAAFRRPVVFISTLVTLSLVAILGVTTAYAICVPTVYNVTSSAPPPIGNWTDTSGAVWSPSGGFPGCAPGDSASDTNASPTTLIVNSAIPNPIISLNLNCPGCAIDIQSGGSLTLAGNGSVSSSSTIIVEPGGTLTIANGATLTFNAGTSLSVNGGYVDVQTGGILNQSGASTVTNGGTLNVSGTWHVNNLFTVQSNGSVTLDGATVDGSNTISNNGVVSQSGADSTINSILNNTSTGTVHVYSGMLHVGGGGNGNGPFSIDSGATLDFPSSSYTMTTNGVVSGAGTLGVAGGTLSIGGVTSPGGFTITAGTLTGAGFLSTNNFTWSGGTITGSGGTQLNGSGNGSIDGANGAMLLDGRTFNDYGYITFSATTNPLTLNNNALFAIYGTMVIGSDGTIGDGGGGTNLFSVAPNGLLWKVGSSGTATISAPFANNATTISSQGELVISGDGTSTGGFFVDSGAEITFAASSTSLQGSVFGGGTISFPSGSTTFSGCCFSVEETEIYGGTLTMFASGDTNGFMFDAGTLGIASNVTFTLNNTGTWASGTINGGGTFDVAGTLTIDAANGNTLLSGTELKNDGTVNYTAAAPNELMTSNALITNNGLFDIQTDQPIAENAIIIGFAKAPPPPRKKGHSDGLLGSGSTIQNNGTFQKSSGSGTTNVDPAFSNDGTMKAASGTLDFTTSYTQSSGTTTLGPGNITVATTMQLSGGELNGMGTVTGNVQNDATVAPGTGLTTCTITVTGNYTQGPGGKLAIDLGGPAAFDALAAGGSTTLDGTLDVALINSYQPANGATFPVHTFATRSGDFAVKNLPTYGAFGSITSNYQPTELDLIAVVAPNADVQITKSGPSGVIAGQNVVYTVTVTNNGPSTAAGVVVADPTPANLTFVSNGGDCTGAYPCNLGSLASGQTMVITSTYSTSPSFSGNVTNQATVSSTTADPNTGNNSSSIVTTNVGAQADLAVAKSGPATAIPGQNVTYTVTVTNNGPSPATGVVVTDSTPAGLAFVSNTGSCTTPYPCNVGGLAASQTATIMSTYTIPSNFTGASTSNTASASSAVNDPNNSDNSATATTTVVQQADLAISKTGPPSASPGQLVSYTVTVTNLGPSTASSIVVTDPTPAGLTFVSNTGACTTAYPCNLAAPLPAGQTATITTTYSVPANYAGTSITNTASVSSAASDSNPSNNSSSVTTPVTASADLSINKSGPASFTTGTNISYTIAVTNNGPLSAANVFVTDPTPSGLTFVSNSGACTTPFPCALGTLTSGQTSTIIATFNVPSGYPGASISNTATVSSSTNDGNGANNASTVTTPLASGSSIDLSVVKSGPPQTNPSNTVTFQIFVMNGSALAATNVNVADPTPAGLAFVANAGACTTPFPCTIASIAPHSSATIQATYFVQSTGGNITNTVSVSSAATDPQPSNNSSSFTISVAPPPQCPPGGPTLVSPANASVGVAPVSLVWTAVDNATTYLVTINGGGGVPKQITTGATSALVTLPNGIYTWTVEAVGDAGCDPQSSAVGTFSICTPPSGAPTPSIPGQMTTGQNYTLEWTAVDGAATYEVQESPDSTFTSVTSSTTVSPLEQFSKQVTTPTAFFYRVRAIASCNFQGPFSQFVAIVVVPVPAPDAVSPSVNVPVGSTKPVTWQIHIPGLPGITTSYVATTDKPWISIVPVSGIIGPDGVNLTISLNPSDLQNGTWTGTILVIYGTSGVTSRVHTDASTSIPVSVNVVTPVSPQPLTGASTTALVVPSLGFLASAGSTWRSDIRLANIGSQIQKYQLSFNNGTGTMKQTFLNIDAGATTALDDFVRTWFGVGPLGDSANGALTIQAIDASGKPVANNLNTIVSSRTFNAVGTSTLGQFIAATPFASFIGRSTSSAPSILSLQQIAQSDLFRTNLGLVEAANKSASVIVSVFNGAGSKLLDLPMSLKAGEQKQLNSFLLQNGITLSNGHVEVQVTSGDGKVTAYASVIDSGSSDPFFVTGVPLGVSNANRFVVPGVAEINSASANWRSDLRVLNGGNSPQTATLTFYPSSNAANSVSQQITINPGEVKALDNVLQSAFGLTDTGGVLHVTTNNNAPLVVTARTFNQTPGGSVGQFIPAITPADSVGSGGRALQILQLEESPRYRTNIGLAEVNGKPAMAEISVVLPDSKVSPVVQVPLGAFEFVQLPVLSSLGIGNVYNTRISVRVVGGDGKVTAYGSVIDRNTSDATYVPAQ